MESCLTSLDLRKLQTAAADFISDGANNGDDCASGNEMEITQVQADYLTSYATLTLSMPEQSQKERIYNLLTKMAVEEIEDVGFDASPLNSGEVDAYRERMRGENERQRQRQQQPRDAALNKEEGEEFANEGKTIASFHVSGMSCAVCAGSVERDSGCGNKCPPEGCF